MTPRLLLAAVLVTAMPAVQAQHGGAAQDPAGAAWLDARDAAHDAHTARLVAAFAASNDARELALAEMLRNIVQTAPDGVAVPKDAPSTRTPRDAQAEARLRVAASRAGNDVIANQFVIAAAGTDAAARVPAAKRWQAADPGNLVPLLFLDLPADALLAEARRATDADAHVYVGVRWMRSVLAARPPTVEEQQALSGGEPFHADEAAAVLAMAYWAGGVLPNYHVLAQACRSTVLQASPTRVADCRHVAGLLADHSDNVLGERTGLSMLVELAPRGPERDAVETRMRGMDWRMQQWGRLASQQPRDGAAQFARLLDDPSVRSEQQLAARVLQEGGVPSDPPQGWRAPRY